MMSPKQVTELSEGMQTALADVKSGRDAVATLVRLLQTPSEQAVDLGTADGLAALLDGVRTRLDLAFDGLQAAAFQLGVEVTS